MNIARRHLSKFIERCPIESGCDCSILNELPKPIDFEQDLNGTKILPWKHLLILSHGYHDAAQWPSKLELVPGTLANEMDSLKRKVLSPYHPVMISNAIIPDVAQGSRQKVHLYPDNKEIEFDMADARRFMQTYLVPEAEELSQYEPVYNPFKSESLPQTKQTHAFAERPLERELVLICGHGQRDQRCGMMAPVLQTKFQAAVARRSLAVDVGIVSHVGGHAYAGNVVYFPRGRDPVWYGRVLPSSVEGIVDETIVKGNVIRELYRGETRP